MSKATFVHVGITNKITKVELIVGVLHDIIFK